MVGRVAEVRTWLHCNLNLPLHRGFESRTIRIKTTTENQVLNSDGEPYEGHHGEVAGNCAENYHPETNTYTEARGNAR